MGRRSFLAFTLLASTLGLFAATPADARRRPPPPDEQRVVVPVPRLIAHEWGVFVVENGRPVHLEALAAELPPFVQRHGGAAVLPAPAPPVNGVLPGTIARKPVLFLYADRPTQVRVQVGFMGGEPWLAYPSAQRVEDVTGNGTPGLVWTVLVRPGRAAVPPAVHPGHFWSDLRAVGASTVISPDGTSERFLFYDGPVAFEPSFLVGHAEGGAAITPASTERTIFLVQGGRYVEAEVNPNDMSSRAVSTGDAAGLRQRIDQLLQQRGLSAAESRSLIETWRDELLNDARRRAIYFVPRDAYDRMLPMTITPTPTQTVRVGLVIDRG